MAAKKKTRKGPGFGDFLRENVSESSSVPDGGYLAEIVDAECVQTREAGKKMYHCELQVVEPEEYAGARLDDYMVFGSDEDPDAEDPRTLKRSRGVKQFRKLARCAGVLGEIGDDDEENCDLLKECKVYAVVSMKVEEEGDYKGEVRNRITNYFPEGERDPEVTGELPEPGAKKSVKAALKSVKTKAKAVKAPVADEDDDDEEEEEEEKPKAKAKVKAKPAAKEEEEDDDEDDDDDEEEDDEKEEETDDDDDEDDDDEDDDESPPKGRGRK